MTAQSDPHIFMLVTDDAVEESHTSHILAKYHFSNSLVCIRKASEASEYFTGEGKAETPEEVRLPELILISMGNGTASNRLLAMETRTGRFKDVPLIIVAWDREEEEAVKRLNLPGTACISRPVGFFKLLEAMQKLGMRWIVLRPD